MEQGVIKFFDSRQDRRFGFILLHSGDEIFFHFNDGVLFRPGFGEPEFSEVPYGEDPLTGEYLRLREPRIGDVIVFGRQPGRKGPKASPWGHLDDWERVERIIDQRAWRVMRQTTPRGGATLQSVITWEGKSLGELSQEFPRTKDPEQDELAAQRANRHFLTNTWFERRGNDGRWARTPDPRRRKWMAREIRVHC